MDVLSHTLVGATLSQLDGIRELGPAAAVTLVAASNFPDLDVVVRLKDSTAYLQHHRGYTHGVATLPLQAALLTGILWTWPAVRDLGFWNTFLLALLGLAVHVAMDLLTPFGTKILLPFRETTVSTSSFPIFEPILLAATAVLLGFSYLHRELAGDLAWIILSLWGFTLATYALFKFRVDRHLLRRHGRRAERTETYPIPGIPFLWLCVVQESRRTLTFTVNALTGRRRRFRSYPRRRIPKSLLKSRTARVFVKHSRFPHVEVEPGPGGSKTYHIRDLRYDYPFRRKFFQGRVAADPKGTVVEEHFRL